jgi:hypothetical protein
MSKSVDDAYQEFGAAFAAFSGVQETLEVAKIREPSKAAFSAAQKTLEVARVRLTKAREAIERADPNYKTDPRYIELMDRNVA